MNEVLLSPETRWSYLLLSLDLGLVEPGCMLLLELLLRGPLSLSLSLLGLDVAGRGLGLGLGLALALTFCSEECEGEEGEEEVG
jgi:hypothetical protein